MTDFDGYFIPIGENDFEFNFGKMRGKLLSDVAESDPDYLTWMMKGNFPKDVQELIQNVLDDVTGFIQGVKV